jgi:NTE family protein
VPAVMASSAIPAVYPTVQLDDGRTLMDGDLAEPTSLDRAMELGADEIYLLTSVAGGENTPQPPQPPSSALAMAMHAFTLLARHRMASATARAAHAVRLHRIPAPAVPDMLPIDFAHTATLIEEATASTSQWLRAADGRRGRSRLLRMPAPAWRGARRRRPAGRDTSGAGAEAAG